MTADVLEEERAFLDKVFHTYNVCNSPLEAAMRRFAVKTFEPHIRRGRGLELGCSDGLMTEMLAQRVARLDVVDGSRKFLRKASQRQLSNVRFIYSLFEEFRPARKYDCIFASYILEHVLDPVGVLRVARSLLTRMGYLFVIVPNAHAASRQLAVHMGLIRGVKELSQNDYDHGHRRVYDRATLIADLEIAGFEIIQQGGLFFKILADFQMDQLIQSGFLKEAHLDALHRLGEEYPELCGSLYAICKVKR
jgi:2-polyprenyl-3-methyl-5-hydroxy-6-metoxy-1,4-benzoquinol methylase